MKPDELKELVTILNPDKIEGRVILITRYGHDKVGAMLPAHIKAVQESGIPVVWQCDGVHGNTVTASNKLKTRKFDDVMSECIRALQIHRENGSVLAGIHLEMTGQETVTECTGVFPADTPAMRRKLRGRVSWFPLHQCLRDCPLCRAQVARSISSRRC